MIQAIANGKARTKNRKTRTITLVRAQVGYTGSSADKRRLELMSTWLHDNRNNVLKLTETTPVDDIKFDLTYQGGKDPLYGCDFLTDTRPCDVVILHHLFSGWPDNEIATRPPIAQHFSFNCSAQQSPHAWRTRLDACNASIVFVFGGRYEIGPSYIGDIPGFRTQFTPFGAVYERIRMRR